MLETAITTMPHPKIPFARKIPRLAPTVMAVLAYASTPVNSLMALDKPPARQQPLHTTSATSSAAKVAKQQNATLVEYSIITDKFTVNGKQQTQESELYIWVIKPTGEIVFRKVDLKPLWQKDNTSLSNLITSSRQSIGVRSSGNKGEIKVEAIEQKDSRNIGLKKLHELLIQPIADVLPTQPQEHVVFIPQGALFLVPFAALQDANGKYLIERHAIATAPSIQALDLLYQRRVETRNCTSCRNAYASLQNALVVGNPTMPNVPPKLGEKPDRLSPLPGAEKEAKAIAQMLNTQALTGDAATETTIVKRMPQVRIIHLATHAFTEEQQGLGSALAFAPSKGDDGLLTASEILDMKLNAELVVLSSDSTALGRITGDGVIGLSRAFFAAGATSVIGSVWSVSDTPTVFLMTKFYENLLKNPDKAAALRQAMLATIDKYANPSDWAGFILIGVS